MPKYYCDYCDIYLTHDSSSVRKSHNTGWKHRMHVENYFAGLPQEKIDEVIRAISAAYDKKPGIRPRPMHMPMPMGTFRAGLPGARPSMPPPMFRPGMPPPPGMPAPMFRPGMPGPPPGFHPPPQFRQQGMPPGSIPGPPPQSLKRGRE